MWRSSVAKMKFRIEKGMHIVVHGSVSVYTPRGEYQLQAVHIEPYGQGALALAFEQLKKKLQAKGYFDASRKKALPPMPERIALVTAKESAALADMLRIIDKRWPLVEVCIVDTLVQGEEAAPSIARALRYADTLGCDIVVVGRGGGSKEDLWAFNEEIVADAIFTMRTPVVSAVGHEVDTHISDMTADLRAPTPSAAMEMILPDRNEVLRMLDERYEQIRRVIIQTLHRSDERLIHLQRTLQHYAPSYMIERQSKEFLRQRDMLEKRYRFVLEQRQYVLNTTQEMLRHAMMTLLQRKAAECETVQKHLEMSEPSKRLKGGWGQIVKNNKPLAPEMIEKGDKFEVQNAFVVLKAQCLSKKKLR
jgi:exodeoxyribonuclease VII large subunit